MVKLLLERGARIDAKTKVSATCGNTKPTLSLYLTLRKGGYALKQRAQRNRSNWLDVAVCQRHKKYRFFF